MQRQHYVPLEHSIISNFIHHGRALFTSLTSMIQTFLSEISMIHKISRQNFDYQPLLETLYGNKIQKLRSHQAGLTERKSYKFQNFNFGNVTERDSWEENGIFESLILRTENFIKDRSFSVDRPFLTWHRIL